jgi:NAD(P)-dependent dehydrogenase (short-subunit alcohol dehydrogenase family)
MEIKLRLKNIIVTGGGSGIGFAAAKRLLEAGSNVVIAGRNSGKLDDAGGKLLSETGRSVKTLVLDVTDVKSHNSKILEAQELFGHENPIDGLVQCAGLYYDPYNWKGFNISEEDYDNVININLKGPFFFMRNIVNYMISCKTRGNICNVISMTEWIDTVGPYEISKLALSRVTKAYGKYLGEWGIILNGVDPGVVKTAMSPTPGISDGVAPGELFSQNSIGRVLRPEEIAETIFFLMTNLGETFAGSVVVQSAGFKGMWIG